MESTYSQNTIKVVEAKTGAGCRMWESSGQGREACRERREAGRPGGRPGSRPTSRKGRWCVMREWRG